VITAEVGGDEHWVDQSARTPRTEIVEGFPSAVVDDFGTYLTEDLTDRAVEVIEDAGDEPLFLYLAYTAPHAPFQTTREYYDRFPDISDHDRRVYAGMISALDDGIGEVMDALDRTGLAENTIVVFLSDNGCAGYTGVCSCEPVRGGKTSHLEGGVRVPFVVTWPGHVPAATSYDGLSSAMDVLATVAVAAGVDLAPLALDGVDLVPHLAGDDPSEPHDALFWRSGSQRTARVGDLKLWTSGVDALVQLFDLSVDPLELDDRTRRQPADVLALAEEWRAWNDELARPAWTSTRATVTDQCGTTLHVDP
jgi:arylsulfatase A-like enzyme